MEILNSVTKLVVSLAEQREVHGRRLKTQLKNLENKEENKYFEQITRENIIELSAKISTLNNTIASLEEIID